MKLPTTSVRVKGFAKGVPILDMRDGMEHAALQLKLPTEYVQGLRWNEYCDRSCTGFHSGHESHLLRLMRKARKDKERILWASLHNYGVSIAVASV